MHIVIYIYNQIVHPMVFHTHHISTINIYEPHPMVHDLNPAPFRLRFELSRGDNLDRRRKSSRVSPAPETPWQNVSQDAS